MTTEQFIMKVLAIAKIGKKFSTDAYALENYEELEELGLQFLNEYSEIDFTENPFTRDLYPTVNVSVRTICFNDEGKILMVKEKSEHLWSFPGGWCDVYESPSANALKEIFQESGYLAEIKRLIGVFFRDNYKTAKKRIISEYALYFEGKLIEQVGSFNHEIEDMGFFDIDDLPPLSYKNSQEEVSKALECIKNNSTTFD